VYDVAGSYLGCCYLYPMGRRTPLSEVTAEYDVDVSRKPYFSNREIPSD
jgi:hypothetical protein